jgi:hypothetical protein
MRDVPGAALAERDDALVQTVAHAAVHVLEQELVDSLKLRRHDETGDAVDVVREEAGGDRVEPPRIGERVVVGVRDDRRGRHESPRLRALSSPGFGSTT